MGSDEGAAWRGVYQMRWTRKRARPYLSWMMKVVLAGVPRSLFPLVVLAAIGVPISPAPVRGESDPRATALAESLLVALGGRDSWERTRYLRWNFRERRLHHWDRRTGDVRIESGTRLVLMNLRTRSGRAWDGGTEITEAAALTEALETGYAWWVNDSYWLVMPYKLLDPGVVLRWGGPAPLEDGRPAERIEVSFHEGTGLTPQNKYDVWIGEESGLVEQWAYYANADDPEPRFTLPWAGWKRFGEILLATDHGRGENWEISAPEELPRSVFTEP